MSEFKLNIDGREVSAQEGQTILQAALANGIDIPHLCYDPRLTPTGACRLCLVEIEGQARPAHLLHAHGRAGHDRAHRHRGRGPLAQVHAGVAAERAQRLLHHLRRGRRLPAAGLRLPLPGGRGALRQAAATPAREPDTYTAGHKGIVYDPSKCVRCQRCVKICAEVEMAEALTLKGRALDVQVSTAFDLPLNDSTCEICGLCVSACPTGALWERAAAARAAPRTWSRSAPPAPTAASAASST